MSDRQTLTEDTLRARRKLVRGVFAAPTVLTLYSGRALAASSSMCLANQEALDIPDVSTSADNYYRVQLYKEESADTYYYYSATDTKYYLFDLANNTVGVEATPTTPVLTSQYAAARFTVAGSTVTFSGVGEGNGTALTVSCAASLAVDFNGFNA